MTSNAIELEAVTRSMMPRNILRVMRDYYGCSSPVLRMLLEKEDERRRTKDDVGRWEDDGGRAA